MRSVITVLCALLSLLLANMGYQIAQYINVARYDDGMIGPNDDYDDGIVRRDKSVNLVERKLDEGDEYRNFRDDVNADGDGTKSQYEDEDEYRMSHHSTKIYKHTAILSKNYRGGGVLSEDMLRRYEKDGFILIRNLISPKLLDRLDSANQMLVDEQRRKDEDDDEKTRKSRWVEGGREEWKEEERCLSFFTS